MIVVRSIVSGGQKRMNCCKLFEFCLITVNDNEIYNHNLNVHVVVERDSRGVEA